MADYFIYGTTMLDIADAIRSKTGGMSRLTPAAMGAELDGMAAPSGSAEFTENGSYNVAGIKTARVRTGTSGNQFAWGFAPDTGTLTITDPDNPLPDDAGEEVG